MKRVSLLLAGVLILSACQQDKNEEAAETENAGNTVHENEEQERSPDPDFTLNLYTMKDQEVVSVSELAEESGGSYHYEPVHRTLEMALKGQQFKLIYGVPVLERNGLYLDTDQVKLVLDEEEEETPYLPLSFLDYGLEANVKQEEQTVSVYTDAEAVEAFASPDDTFDLHSKSVEDMIEYLSFLDYPIKGAQVSTVESHLPGAPRDYRNGYHEGIDWYDWTTEAVINTETPVYGMAEGTVVRVDHDYEEYSSPEVRDEELSITYELGFTPEYLLDRLRGQQVWVQYDNGVMNRFAHLFDIPEELKLGARINAETIIGYVGNSGTSGAVNDDGSELHLHHDLLIYGDYFWEPFSLEETTEIIQAIWG
ncbi:peptidase M23 [Alteribacter lacisalsi]|uniref:Peptidase M23 n=1 Tax=Alteribacter lacisalsi TaxID=2045244 RepID=A0A2W0H7J2_9BACI|nr:M23 family metallopeptidase [Alteribacter lacisalsi]PYZ97833.1 peptidase M23 [Alteribacter lacisalsi]